MSINYKTIFLLVLHYVIGNEYVPVENSLCMTVELIRAANNPQAFYQCIPFNHQEIESYFSTDNMIGIWKKQICPGDHQFDYLRQGCTEKNNLRRQQPKCQQNPFAKGCEKSCHVTNMTPVQMGPCNWLSSNLQLDATNNAAYLQCVPQQTRSCGIWTSRLCSEGTVFDERLQICVPDRLMGCPKGTLPVGRCSQQSFMNICPGDSRCTEEYQVCCQPVPVPQINYEQSLHSIPMHISNNLLPHVCPPNTGPPVSACSSVQSCPPGTICYPISGLCCSIAIETARPLPLPLPLPVPQQPMEKPIPVLQQIGQQQQIVIMCPNGLPGIQPCGFMEQCPSNSGCFRGVCCPLVCPSGQDATGFCGKGVAINLSCPQQADCISGCCCQQHEPIRLPICPSGIMATSMCTVNEECGPGMECSSGGCCPIPFCPTGIQAVGRCPSGMGCPSATICANGLCCPSPRCSSGIVAVRICVSNAECGSGFECASGGCCPLPLCPNNQIGSQRCSPGGCCCPTGQQCVNGVCCPLPACSNGVLSATMCGAGKVCPQAMECYNGGCCPLPVCSSGAPPSGRCHGNSCPHGQVCENGICCPLPICSNGQLAVQLCTYGTNCPMGYICEGRGCCPEPLPLCPSGAHTNQRCNRGTDCPPGFGCTPAGVCCPLSLEPTCPSNQNAICQCASSNNCPPQSSCTMGTCCTSAAMKMYDHVPGTPCQTSSQCNGFNIGGAQCMQSVCACINGAASNGATCHQFNPAVLLQARSGCDQYGSPCKFVFSTARRKPILTPIGNISTQPLWYTVMTSRRCLWNATSISFDPDSTCLPNEKCIEGECRMKLWPGEYGCTSDEECSARCSNTYCSANSDKGISQCQCINGKLLYGRCFQQCPADFHVNGAYCEHDDEDLFWNNGNEQNSLRELLNSRTC